MVNINDIIKGHWNEVFDKNDDISKNRLNICYSCPLYTPKLGGMCNNRLYLDPITGDVSTVKKEGYKKGCGCKISMKVRNASSTCPLDKW